MFDAVIFDWDGTLGDTREAIVLSFQKTLREIKVNVTEEYISRRIGIGAADTYRDILQSAKRPFDEETIKHLVDRKSELEIEHADLVKLLPGVLQLLDALHGKIRMGLASMNNFAVINHLVKAKGVTKYFDVILTAESIQHSKPHPEIFLRTASLLKAAPERCVVVEDSVFGVKAAKAAMMGCVAVTTGVYAESELEREKPDLIVASLEDKRVLSFILQGR